MTVRGARSIIFVSAGLALSLLLAGCTPVAVPEAEPTSVPAATMAPAYPTTLIHSGGETTLEKKPTRVATFGGAQTDAALALGVVPVASEPSVYAPWRLDALAELGGTAPVELEPADFGSGHGDTVAGLQALNPDLIVAGQARYFYDSGSALIDMFYNALPEVAPTVRLPDTAISTQAPDREREYAYETGTAWRDAVLQAGQAYGNAQRGTELLADIDASLAEAAAAHPEFQGRTVAVLVAQPGSKAVLEPTAAFPLVLEQLGFIPFDTSMVSNGPRDNFGPQVTVGFEELAVLDVDIVLVVGSYDPEVVWNEPLEQSPAGQNGVIHYLAPDKDAWSTTWALTSPTVLSLPWVLDSFVDAIAGALK